MRYYREIKSLDELIGEEGIWRLPSYLPEEYVMDEIRKETLSKALDYISRGENILIVGRPGTGKTAFMFILLRELIRRGFHAGVILEGVGAIGREHEEAGFVLFYDDLPRMRKEALISIFRGRVKNIVATARTEEISDLISISGEDPWTLFRKIEIPGMDKENLREMLYRYARREGIKILDEEATNLVCEKAQGLPVYIWQLVRELKIRNLDLTINFAEQIPQGMLDYVDDILWRVLDEHPERYEVLLTLLIMSDMPRYAIHQDLYNAVFVISKERRSGRKLSIEEALFSDLLDKITRYLMRESVTYSFRLPHDSWADVLKGRSRGPMSGEISRINTAYPSSRRREVLLEAAMRVWNDILKHSEDNIRREHFLENLSSIFSEEEIQNILSEARKREETAPMPAEMEPKLKVMPHKEISVDVLKSYIQHPENIGLQETKLALDILSTGEADSEILNAAAALLIQKWRITGDDTVLPIAIRALENIKSAKSMYNLAMIYYLRKNYNLAERYFEKASDMGESLALFGLALSCIRQGKFRKGIEALRQYTIRNPQDSEARLLFKMINDKLREKRR